MRVLAPERPGLGFSRRGRGGRWSTPRRTCARSLRRSRSAASACSASRAAAPHALACAHERPELLDGVAVVCGLGPVTGRALTAGIAFKERIGYAIGSRVPGLAVRALVPVAACARRWPRLFLQVTGWQLA